jgi:hypothetical protein
MNNKNLIVILAVGAIVFLLMRKPQPASANGLTSPGEGTILDRLLPWYQSQRGTTQNAQPNVLISRNSGQDNLGQYIATGGKALSDLVRAVGSVWPRNAPTVTKNTSAPSIVPLTSTGGAYYDWNAFDSFLGGPQGPVTGPVDRPNYVFDWNRM